MLMKILAASAFTIALATSAMAQSTNASGADGSAGSGKSITVDPSTPASPNTVDPTVVDPSATNSTTMSPGDMNSNADRNCPNNPQGAQSDANGNATAPTVNDKNCGK